MKCFSSTQGHCQLLYQPQSFISCKSVLVLPLFAWRRRDGLVNRPFSYFIAEKTCNNRLLPIFVLYIFITINNNSQRIIFSSVWWLSWFDISTFFNSKRIAVFFKSEILIAGSPCCSLLNKADQKGDTAVSSYPMTLPDNENADFSTSHRRASQL